MMTGRAMQGVFPILVTPLDEGSQIDEESLRRLIEFNLEAGVHGLGVALGSEVFKLTEAERDAVTGIVVDQVAGRVPVVINTGAQGTDLAVHYSRMAEANGADALMVLPPSFFPVGADEIAAYYRAISDAVPLPIFIQDVPASPIAPVLARRLAEAGEWVRYIKVESLPVVERVAAMASQAGEGLTIFGGAGGGFFIEELRRGSVGTMPFCTQPEAFVDIWDRMRAGDEAGARETFDRYLQPVARFSAQGSGLFYAVHKEILRHRGVIRTAKVREPAPPLDDMTREELALLLAELYPK
ncbi:MAG: dihydrodipicolinate synthase family protein [Caldilineaceae bacterium]|nr:dihydrodipicolinate synthase family protein [Caldilineaceae bacterium]